MVCKLVNRLSAAFRCAGYTVECALREPVPDNGILGGPFETDTKWIGVTCTTAVWGVVPPGSYVRVNTEMGCENRMISCNSSVFVTRSAGNRIGAAEFVSIACGECAPGERIYFKASPEVNCTASDNEEEQPVSGIIETTEITNALVFIFKKLENDLPVIPQISSQCIFKDNVDAIKNAANLIHTAACQVQKPTKTVHPYTHSGATGTHSIIVPASPPPPEPAEKKWLILGSMQAQITIPNPKDFDDDLTVAPEFFYQIKCGGDIVHTSPTYVWPAYIRRTTLPLSYRVPVCAFVTCPVELPVRICTTINDQNLAVQERGVSEGMAICIS